MIDAHPVREYDQVGEYRVSGGRREKPLAAGYLVQVFTKLLRRRRRRRRYVGRIAIACDVILPIARQFLDGGLDYSPFARGPEIRYMVKSNANLHDAPISRNGNDRS